MNFEEANELLTLWFHLPQKPAEFLADEAKEAFGHKAFSSICCGCKHSRFAKQDIDYINCVYESMFTSECNFFTEVQQ